MREDFEKLPEIARMVACEEIKWCDVYKWYRTDNTDANSIYHVAWLNGAWYSFQEQQKKIDKIIESVNGFKLAASSFDTEYNEGGYMACTLMLNDIENILK